LKPSGTVAMSSWAEASDSFSAAWREYLEAAIGADQVEHATDQVIPSEGHFAQPGGLAAALTRAGLPVAASDTVDLDLAPSVEEFVEDRALTPGGRLGRALLGDQEWARFTARCRDALGSRFGPRLRYSRRAFIVVAGKAGHP